MIQIQSNTMTWPHFVIIPLGLGHLKFQSFYKSTSKNLATCPNFVLFCFIFINFFLKLNESSFYWFNFSYIYFVGKHLFLSCSFGGLDTIKKQQKSGPKKKKLIYSKKTRRTKKKKKKGIEKVHSFFSAQQI